MDVERKSQKHSEYEQSIELTFELLSFFSVFNEDTNKDLKRLAKDLDICYKGNENVEVVHTGSGYEKLYLPHIEGPYDNKLSVDADHMIVRKDIKVYDTSSHQESNTPLIINDDSNNNSNEKNEDIPNNLYLINGSHNGYVYVLKKMYHRKLKDDNDSFLKNICVKNSEFINKCKKEMSFSTSVMMANDGHINGPSFTDYFNSGKFIIHRDFVFSLECHFWPDQAKAWLTRSRKWPSDDLIDAVTSHGCHIVPVSSHNTHLLDYEWRISFSLAEILLINSLPEKIKLSYSILKGLIKISMKREDVTIFASYYLKTALFWFVEKLGLDVLKKWSINQIVIQLLEFFTTFYKRNCVRNFFVCSNNMIDHQDKKETEKCFHLLQKMKDDFLTFLCLYMDSCHILPVQFDKNCNELVYQEEKFTLLCKYNFFVMSLTHKLMAYKGEIEFHDSLGYNFYLKAVELCNNDVVTKGLSFETVTEPDSFSVHTILDALSNSLGGDNLPVTESSAVALGVFNVFLTTKPCMWDKQIAGIKTTDSDILEYFFAKKIFLDVLYWSASTHETSSDIIYEFVKNKWINGPSISTEGSKHANGVKKLIMVVLGKPTRQAKTVTGSLVRTDSVGTMSFTLRILADYLLYLDLETAYVAFQFVAFLINSSVLKELLSHLKYTTCKRTKVYITELIFSHKELKENLTKQELEYMEKLESELLISS